MASEDRQTIGSVTYSVAGKSYFERRSLGRYAGPWSLWALGVGAVISGEFFLWNFGLAAGGFGGMLIATAIVAVLYIALAASMAEMSAALPHAGGAYSFARMAFGPWGGLLGGIAQTMEFVLAPAVMVVGIGSYSGLIAERLLGIEIAGPVWWLAVYAIFIALNVWSAKAAFRAAIGLTAVALAVLAVFWIGAIPHFSWEQALDIAPGDAAGAWLPYGWRGVFEALPFAIWFFLAIELLPLAAEESDDPRRALPSGLLFAVATLVAAAGLTLFLCAGIEPGAAAIGNANEPLILAFRTVFGPALGVPLLALLALTAMAASFHALLYAYSRNIFALSRAGYLPRWLSLTHKTRKTPHLALLAGAVAGYAAALLVALGGESVSAVLLSMVALAAVATYLLQLLSFLVMRHYLPQIERPFRSPLGMSGAWTAAAVALAVLFALFFDDTRPWDVVGCALWFAVGLGFFALRSRHRLAYAPEEKLAIKYRGETGPQS